MKSQFQNFSNTQTSHSDWFHIPNITCCFALFFSLCLTFLYLLFPFHFLWLSTSSALKHPWEEAGTCTFRFPCILGTPHCWKTFLRVNWAIAKASELLHWHLQKPLVHPLAIHSYDTSCLFRMSSTLPGYLDQTHLGWSFWASRKPSPSNTACRFPSETSASYPSSPKGRQT